MVLTSTIFVVSSLISAPQLRLLEKRIWKCNRFILINLLPNGKQWLFAFSSSDSEIEVSCDLMNPQGSSQTLLILLISMMSLLAATFRRVQSPLPACTEYRSCFLERHLAPSPVESLCITFSSSERKNMHKSLTALAAASIGLTLAGCSNPPPVVQPDPLIIEHEKTLDRVHVRDDSMEFYDESRGGVAVRHHTAAHVL